MTTSLIDTQTNLESLLKSTTYQGMTDEEIQAVIDYKLAQLAREYELEIERVKAENVHNALIASADAAAEAAQQAFDRAMNLVPSYEVV